jgi:chemotaxis protein methyltransferase CheR
MQLDRPTLERLSQQVRRLCGLVVTSDKEYLLRDRLGPVLRRHGWQVFAQLADRLDSPAQVALADEVVEALMTHETAFFRDPHVWEALRREVFPGLLARRTPAGPRVRFWSAATSTGQEAYTMAILAQEYVEAQAGKAAPAESFSILATDICSSALQSGSAAEYDLWQMRRGISDQRQACFFEPREKRWRVREPLRRVVDFRRVNLVEPLPRLGAFELICCRNVLIYFDEAIRKRVCEQLHSLLVQGGWLVLGAAENLYGITERFESVSLGDVLVYRKA